MDYVTCADVLPYVKLAYYCIEGGGPRGWALLLDSDDEAGGIGDPATRRYEHNNYPHLWIRNDTFTIATQKPLSLALSILLSNIFAHHS